MPTWHFLFNKDINLKEIRSFKELTKLDASLIYSVSLRKHKRLELDSKYKESDEYKNTINSRLTSKII